MDRRRFCRGAIAASMAAALPPLAGCRKREPAVTGADTTIPAIDLDGGEIDLEKAAVNELAAALAGTLMLSGHPQYDSTRKLWNGMHDKHPALIAQCASAEDVSAAVTFARERRLLTAVRGGGHSWPGKSVCDGGLMIDLSVMNDVRIDPQRKLAFAGGGALLNGLDSAAREHELITTAGVVSHTGVGGYTLGGGFGRVGELETAFPHRNAETMLVFTSFWTDPADDDHCRTATRNWYAALEPYTGGYYDNIDFDDENAHVGNYGLAYGRLAKIKAEVDPGNLFRLNSNIRPA